MNMCAKAMRMSVFFGSIFWHFDQLLHDMVSKGKWQPMFRFLVAEKAVGYNPIPQARMIALTK